MITVPIALVFLPSEIVLALVNLPISQRSDELEHADYLGGPRNWERPQRDTIQHGEDAGIETDAEGDGEHRYGCECWILA